jgi:acyl-CoA synthetase (AMP-forming)/AMP-acid ligase II
VVDGVRYSLPGDWAALEADGTIRLLGRGSQCINTGGEKVYPEEVEEAIKRHPGIADCLVFGLPDERFGQRVVAIASLDGSVDHVDPAAVIDGARTALSSYKLPRRLVLVEEVPRAPNGKADYPGARDLFEAVT